MGLEGSECGLDGCGGVVFKREYRDLCFCFSKYTVSTIGLHRYADRIQHLSTCLIELGSEFVEVLWSSGHESDSVAGFGEETAVGCFMSVHGEDEVRDMYVRCCSSGPFARTSAKYLYLLKTYHCHCRYQRPRIKSGLMTSLCFKFVGL